MRARSLLPLLVLAAACEPMEPSGDPFAPAKVAPPAAAPVDPALAFPEEPAVQLSSEEMQGAPGAEGAAVLAEAAGVDTDALAAAEPVEEPAAAAAAPAAPAPAAPPVGVPSPVQWPVRLVSTIPQAQPPRAVLGLPGGEERVVSPGSILADQGLVVMSVTGDRVQLAKIEAAGDHARIATVELTSQYPSGPR